MWAPTSRLEEENHFVINTNVYRSVLPTSISCTNGIIVTVVRSSSTMEIRDESFLGSGKIVFIVWIS